MNKNIEKYKTLKNILGEYADKSLADDNITQNEREADICIKKKELGEAAIELIEKYDLIELLENLRAEPLNKKHGFKKLKSGLIIDIDKIFTMHSVPEGGFLVTNIQGINRTYFTQVGEEIEAILFPEPIDHSMD